MIGELNLQFQDADTVVDVLRLLRPEDATAVTDKRVRRAVLANGGEQHHQVGSQILPARDGAGQDRPAVVLEDRDAVDPLVIEMVVEIANVDRPVLMSALRFERHALGFAWWLGRAVQRAVLCQDAPTRPGTKFDAELLEGSMDAEGAQLRILLELADGQDRS